MAEDEKQEEVAEEEEKKSSLPLFIGIGGGALLLIVIALFFMMSGSDSGVAAAIPPAEYIVEEQMFQLKDGSYLRLGFNIVVDEDKVGYVEEILTLTSPGALPHSIHSILGNKTREDLISGKHNRDAFAREIKKILDDEVFAEYNKKQDDPQDMIEVRDILFTEFVTQSG